MFKTRLFSGIILVLIALVTIISGGPVLFVTLLCVSFIGMQELYKACGVRKEKFELLEITGYLGILAYYLSLLFLPEKYHLLAVIFGLLLLMFVYVFT